jgi:hypothetical protein
VTRPPSAVTRRPSAIAPAPEFHAEHTEPAEPAPPPRPERPGIRVTHVELAVVTVSLLVLAAAAFVLVQAGRMRAAERARRLSEPAVTAPVTPPAGTPALDAHVPPPARPARKAAAKPAVTPARPRPAARTEAPASAPDEAPSVRRDPEPAAPEPAAPEPVVPAATPTATAPVPAPAQEPAPATSGEGATWPLLCGQVLDEQGQPIAGARVLLADLDLGARTDRRGRFCLSAPPGDRTLSVVALGFRTLRQPLHVGDAPAELALTLVGAP